MISNWSSLALVAVLATLLSATPSLANDADTDLDAVDSLELYTIDGKVHPPEQRPNDWYWTARVVVEGGWKIGYLKEDNTFTVHGLPSGSYLVEVVHPDHFYEPVRVDINSKGKIRARKLNNVQPSQVQTVSYPLKMKSLGRYRYFQKREEWKLTDMLMNPMVLMMILPLLLITVLPKMMNDPETKKEMEQMQQNMNVQSQMPELSEVMSNFFGGGQAAKPKKAKPIRR